MPAASAIFVRPITPGTSQRSEMLRPGPESERALVEHLSNPCNTVSHVIDEWMHTANPLTFAAGTDTAIGHLVM